MELLLTDKQWARAHQVLAERLRCRQAKGRRAEIAARVMQVGPEIEAKEREQLSRAAAAARARARATTTASMPQGGVNPAQQPSPGAPCGSAKVGGVPSHSRVVSEAPHVAALRAQLAGMKLRALQQRAQELGVPKNKLDDVEEREDIIALIVEASSAQSVNAGAGRGAESTASSEALAILLPHLCKEPSPSFSHQNQDSQASAGAATTSCNGREWIDAANEFLAKYGAAPAASSAVEQRVPASVPQQDRNQQVQSWPEGGHQGHESHPQVRDFSKFWSRLQQHQQHQPHQYMYHPSQCHHSPTAVPRQHPQETTHPPHNYHNQYYTHQPPGQHHNQQWCQNYWNTGGSDNSSGSSYGGSSHPGRPTPGVRYKRDRPMSHKVWVGGIPQSCGSPVAELLRYFEHVAGRVDNVILPTDHVTGKHRGFGFVVFEDEQSVAKIVSESGEQYNLHEFLPGKWVDVKRATEYKEEEHGAKAAHDRASKKPKLANTCMDCGARNPKFCMPRENKKRWCSKCAKNHPEAVKTRTRKEQLQREDRCAVFQWARSRCTCEGQHNSCTSSCGGARCAYWIVGECPNLKNGKVCDRVHECMNCGFKDEASNQVRECPNCPTGWWRKLSMPSNTSELTGNGNGAKAATI